MATFGETNIQAERDMIETESLKMLQSAALSLESSGKDLANLDATDRYSPDRRLLRDLLTLSFTSSRLMDVGGTPISCNMVATAQRNNAFLSLVGDCLSNPETKNAITAALKGSSWTHEHSTKETKRSLGIFRFRDDTDSVSDIPLDSTLAGKETVTMSSTAR